LPIGAEDGTSDFGLPINGRLSDNVTWPQAMSPSPICLTNLPAEISERVLCI